MAEQTFRSPGFFENEIDLSQRASEIVGVPAGVAGTSEMGPAFVPVTVGSYSDFEKKFGSLNSRMFGPYAVREFLKHRTAATYVRVLGAGANESSSDIENTRVAGIVKHAGFRIIGTAVSDDAPLRGHRGCVQFLCARHLTSSNESVGFPSFTSNNSFSDQAGPQGFNIVRGMIFSATGTRVEVLDYNQKYSPSTALDDYASVNPTSSDRLYKTFKLVLSSTAANWTADGYSNVKVFTASLNPTDDNYFGNVLNTDPERFESEQHVLYAAFPVEDEILTVDTAANAIAICSGSASGSAASGISGLTYRDAFGRFDTRYTAPRTTYFISQPYGKKEWELFYFETISDGSVANEKYKISISNLKKPTNPKDPYGTFTIEVRSFDDADTSPQVLERYLLCTLNPNDSNFIAKKIGDFKAYYNFDAELESERRLLVKGKYPNKSSRIRVVLSTELQQKKIPKDALPFGFRGLPVIKTNDSLTDTLQSIRGTYSNPGGAARGVGANGTVGPGRLTFFTGSTEAMTLSGPVSALSSSILPPVPLRFKCTRGKVRLSPAFVGQQGSEEIADSRYYWGCKFDSIPRTGSLSNAVLNSNASTEVNGLFRSYSKFLGIKKLDTLVTGAGADEFNCNKFTLARVALKNSVQQSNGLDNLGATANNAITGTVKEHILETAYIRNGSPDLATYAVSDGYITKRVTFATLLAMTSSLYFNKFVDYSKFTNMMYGGFNGVNILDKDMARMDDRASSGDTGGKAVASPDIGLKMGDDNAFGIGKTNNIIASYRTAARILTDPMSSRANLIAIPGIRDTALTDYVLGQLEDYGKGFYIMEIPGYDSSGNRIFAGTGLASVTKTLEDLESRALDNNYAAAYFPDVTINDPINNQLVDVPASVAVIGAIGFSDNVSYPWFAPAGFNRGSLDFVTNVRVRLNQADRDELYDARINPIATFPRAGFVIFGQKTLQQARTSLDRVNVRRMLLEVKRIIVDVANKIVFEQNTPETRARFIAQSTPLLALVQSQQGIDQFKVVMDASNNTQEDVENNILNGRIVVVPTRAVEFIAIDFIITNAGVSFE